MIDKQKFINSFNRVIHDLTNQIMAVFILLSKQKDYSVHLAEFKALKEKCFSLHEEKKASAFKPRFFSSAGRDSLPFCTERLCLSCVLKMRG